MIVVVVIGVVHRIQRMHAIVIGQIVAVIVEAVRMRAVVETWSWTDADDHPGLVAIAVPAETYRLEVFEDGEAIELTVKFIIRHHRVSP